MGNHSNSPIGIDWGRECSKAALRIRSMSPVPTIRAIAKRASLWRPCQEASRKAAAVIAAQPDRLHGLLDGEGEVVHGARTGC